MSKKRISLTRMPAAELITMDEIKGSPWAQGIYADLTVFVTEDRLPKGHFSTYFGVMQRTRHPNPWIRDLYYLHEFIHMRTLGYNPHQSYSNWVRRITTSEREALLATECLAYLHIPGLRELTFKHEIWMDRFMPKTYPVMDIAERTERLRAERIRALTTPTYGDVPEQQIWAYGKQTEAWCRVWSEVVGHGNFRDRPAYQMVESHMANPEWQADHEEWLAYMTSVSNQTGPVPFLHQAQLFAEIHRLTNEQYGNDVLRR